MASEPEIVAYQAKQERPSLDKKGASVWDEVRSRGRWAHLDGSKDGHN